MTPEEKAVIDAALEWASSKTFIAGEWPGDDLALGYAVQSLIEARENGQRIDHPFQPHPLAGSMVGPFDDYCTEAMRSESLQSWYTCGRPRSEHRS